MGTTSRDELAWNKLTPDEKMERRFAAWLAADGIQFVSSGAAAEYKARVTRISDAIRLRKVPDRVPVCPSVGSFAAYYAGFTQYDVMYDVDKAIEASIKCTLDFQPDIKVGGAAFPGKALDILDWKLFNWPGHGVSKDSGYQFVEKEYMTAGEYDALMLDPTDFWWRVYLPRIVGSLQPLQDLPAPTYYNSATGIPANLARYGLPQVAEALERLVSAGKETLRWQERMAAANRELDSLGFPSLVGGSTEAPFDVIGDALRGTREVMLDMYRRPRKLLEALERFVPVAIRMGVSGARLGNCPIVMIPLHKGSDGFMSDEQFKTFYWPTLLKVILGLVDEGLVVSLFAEGGYNERLEVIRGDLPKGKTIWQFDYTDMGFAKQMLGGIACIMGNVPVAMIHTGTAEETESYCKQLIETAGKGGGFILATGAGIEKTGKAENLRAMIECAKNYGRYS